MPIRDENKKRYPPNWKQISEDIRARAKDCCEACGVRNGALIYRGSHGMRPAWRYASDSVFCPSRCAFDGSELPGTTWDCFDKARDAIKVVLTVAHLDHTPENCSPDNLRAWCQRCHNSYDAPKRAKGVAQRARNKCAIGDLWSES